MLKSAPDREEFDLKGEDAVAQQRVEIRKVFFKPFLYLSLTLYITLA